MQRRLKALEARVGRLEGTRRSRAAPPPPSPRTRGPTCPGCSLTLPARRGATACVWCGFRLDAVKPYRRRG